MDGDTGWWTTSGKIGLPPLARGMGVGRQPRQQLVAGSRGFRCKRCDGTIPEANIVENLDVDREMYGCVK